MFGFFFWLKVKRNPDFALRLFDRDPDCVVNGARQRGYQGPFAVADSTGATNYVQIRGDSIGDVQNRISRRLEAGPSGEVFDTVIERMKADVSVGFLREEWEAVLLACTLVKDRISVETRSQHFVNALDDVLSDAVDLWESDQDFYVIDLKQAAWLAILSALREIAGRSPAEGQPFLEAALTIEERCKAANS